MTAISGDVSPVTVVTIVATSGDGATIAAMFSGITFAGISDEAATATNASGTVTVSWPSSSMNAADEFAAQFVANMLAADTSLTSPITVSGGTQLWLTS